MGQKEGGACTTWFVWCILITPLACACVLHMYYTSTLFHLALVLCLHVRVCVCGGKKFGRQGGRGRGGKKLLRKKYSGTSLIRTVGHPWDQSNCPDYSEVSLCQGENSMYLCKLGTQSSILINQVFLFQRCPTVYTVKKRCLL